MPAITLPEERLNKYLNLPQKMYSLFNDPEWALAASLGDMEFEQDMYDDIMYEDSWLSQMPAGFGENAPSDVRDIFPDYEYDKLAMMGLRKHAMEGLGRYFGPNITGGDLNQNTGTWYPPQTWSNPHRDFSNPALIDFNIPKMFAQVDVMDPMMREMLTRHHPPRSKEEWPYNTYQNYISDIARHEYKHGILDNDNPYAHPAIYGTGAQYDLSAMGSASDYGAFLMPEEAYGHVVENYNPDKAGDLVRDVTDWTDDDYNIGKFGEF